MNWLIGPISRERCSCVRRTTSRSPATPRCSRRLFRSPPTTSAIHRSGTTTRDRPSSSARLASMSTWRGGPAVESSRPATASLLHTLLAMPPGSAPPTPRRRPSRSRRSWPRPRARRNHEERPDRTVRSGRGCGASGDGSDDVTLDVVTDDFAAARRASREGVAAGAWSAVQAVRDDVTLDVAVASLIDAVDALYAVDALARELLLVHLVLRPVVLNGCCDSGLAPS